MEMFVPTTEWLASKFIIFNKMYFDNMLPTPEFKIKALGTRRFAQFEVHGTTISRIGRCMMKKSRPFEAISNIMEATPAITFNSLFKQSETGLEGTLIHEMVHFFTVLNCRYPKQWHGVEFKAKCNEIMNKCNGKYMLYTYHRDKNHDYALDETKESVARRKENKKNNMVVILVDRCGKKQIIFSSQNCSTNIIKSVKSCWGVDNIVVGNSAAAELAFKEYGSFHQSRTYRYYDGARFPKIEKFVNDNILKVVRV